MSNIAYLPFAQKPTYAPDHQQCQISVIGLGYVGAVSMACLSNLGHRMVGADIDRNKVNTISMGLSPIVEKDLGTLLERGVTNNLITAMSNTKLAVQTTDVTFVSVGTPTSEDGGCDMSYVIAAARTIGQALARKRSYHLVVMRCSVPPGTTMAIMVPEIEAVSGKRLGPDFGICFNPEFLREGTAVDDFNNPPKTVIGANDNRAADLLASIYSRIDDNPIITTIANAEMVKYVDNVWHATKVTFANEIGRLCRPLAIDSHQVMDIFCQDEKLNLSKYYLKPGFAFGGSCLPKEVRAVQHIASALGVTLPAIESLLVSNQVHIECAVNMIRKQCPKKVAFYGVSFKPDTDDLRESPILEVMHACLQEGMEVTAYDPNIVGDGRLQNQYDYVKHSAPHLRGLIEALPYIMQPSAEFAAQDADVIVVTHASDLLKCAIADLPPHTHIVDLVRIFDEAPASDNYSGIGW